MDVAIYDVQKTFDTITEKAENILKRGDYLRHRRRPFHQLPLIQLIHNTCQRISLSCSLTVTWISWNENAKKAVIPTAAPFAEAWSCPGKKLVQVGVRSYNTPDFDEYLKRQPITQFTPLQVHEEGAEAIAEKFMTSSTGFNRVYVTICIDGFDPGFAPGCSMSEAFGLLPHHVLTIIKKYFRFPVGLIFVRSLPSRMFMG